MRARLIINSLATTKPRYFDVEYAINAIVFCVSPTPQELAEKYLHSHTKLYDIMCETSRAQLASTANIGSVVKHSAGRTYAIAWKDPTRWQHNNHVPPPPEATSHQGRVQRLPSFLLQFDANLT